MGFEETSIPVPLRSIYPYQSYKWFVVQSNLIQYLILPF